MVRTSCDDSEGDACRRARRVVETNLIATRKREHGRKPNALYPIVGACSPGQVLELFARHPGNDRASQDGEMPEDAP